MNLQDPQYAVISTSASGDTTIVAAQTGKRFRVLSWDLTVNGAVNVKWKSGASTDKTGLYYFSAAGSGISAPEAENGLFETVAGDALVINLSGLVAVGGRVTYLAI